MLLSRDIARPCRNSVRARGIEYPEVKNVRINGLTGLFDVTIKATNGIDNAYFNTGRY